MNCSQAVAPLSEPDLQRPRQTGGSRDSLSTRCWEQTRYFFKHALIQDTAYQSLLKSTRQQYHQQIAQVLEERFPDTKETQPELLAHHYTEAGSDRAGNSVLAAGGQRAAQRSANVEAISHSPRGWSCSRLCRIRRARPARTHAANRLGRAIDSH